MKIPLIVIAGPTASGKTKIAVEVAKKIGAEIISGDSMQIYKGISVGTAKPTKEEMQGIPHYMIDVAEIEDEFSVSDYVEMAKKSIYDINEKGLIPIIVGGTGLYIDSLVFETEFSSISKNEELREKLSKLANEEGPSSVHAILKEKDPEAAQNIHENNVKRVIRAIEIIESTGKPLKESITETKTESTNYDVLYIVLSPMRSALYERIDKRVDEMVDSGIVDEAKFLLGKNNGTVAQAIGYKEFTKYLNGEESIEEAVATLKQNTRRYAKRQLTWFNRHKDAFFIDSYDIGATDEILTLIKDKFSK